MYTNCLSLVLKYHLPNLHINDGHVLRLVFAADVSPVDTHSSYATASANDSDGSPDSGKNSGNEDSREKRRPGG